MVSQDEIVWSRIGSIFFELKDLLEIYKQVLKCLEDPSYSKKSNEAKHKFQYFF